MIFTQELIREIEENPILGLDKACQLINSKQEEFDFTSEWTDEEHDFLWEAVSFITLIIQNYKLEIHIVSPTPTPDIKINCAELSAFIAQVSSVITEQKTLLKIKSYTARYENILSDSFAYEFSQGDLERVQLLLNELRVQISELNELEESHKQRLLRRLEKLQSELHKRVSDLDRFWGLIGDAGVVLGKFGKDAKPIVDRIREIARISWNTQSRAEGLPSNASNPMLETAEG